MSKKNDLKKLQILFYINKNEFFSKYFTLFYQTIHNKNKKNDKNVLKIGKLKN